MSTLQWKRSHIVAVAVSALLLVVILYSSSSQSTLQPQDIRKTMKQQNSYYSHWPRLHLPGSPIEQANIMKDCLQTPPSQFMRLDNIQKIKQQWSQSTTSHCRDLYTAFTSIFTITDFPAKVVIPKKYESKVRKWLGNDEDLFQNAKLQTVLYIYNEYTKEENVFNPLREKRPIAKPEQPERQYVEELFKETQPTCDFCKYKENTAEDVFGRIESKMSFTAANTFKLGAWHTLILPKKHHPLNWTKKEYLDLMDTCMKWVDKAHQENKAFVNPMLIMDLLPHAGASQIHPHVHAFLDRDRYQGAIENWRIGAQRYSEDFPGRNYFSDLVSVHSALGLGVTYGKAVAIASLLPKRDNEVVVISEEPCDDYFKLIYFVYRAFLDDMEKLCYSSGYALPSLDKSGPGRLPAYTRIVTRGAVATVRSETSSLELFTSQNANTDPFRVMDYVRKSIAKRS
ncbi:uncharacterized protein LOC110456517 [Mizuhopecten yessoensis]|uniref:uncharacterized protein LOC110456517 n=1 Tax=Mizuhopecten yessoensis TaxID=6573 RepID=UPI000B45E0DE|nr:uncharacterized protein LOC110456517 [Mizuhopecten yessoensis]XP_021362983.1 uncharacterized protein LOC110456517 [Mizuhopecten yessoensis]XP_021362984.1 uncharacterized protein LOC110456517 [Mizuhopecten yessoensis]XP_021362985.1 uncharacterized protein LOC110456517 [Mizuhopecten yessoensis]